MALQAVVRAFVDVVAIDMGHVREFALDAVDGRCHARITGFDETGER
jgi:hypothetical protein